LAAGLGASFFSSFLTSALAGADPEAAGAPSETFESPLLMTLMGLVLHPGRFCP